MSKSELVNDLIRQAREQQIGVDYIRAKIERGLKNGFSNRTASEILADSKSRLKKMNYVLSKEADEDLIRIHGVLVYINLEKHRLTTIS